jgi:hypothetical protein
MPAKEKIVAEVKILFSAVAGDWVRESSALIGPGNFGPTEMLVFGKI